MTHMRMDQALTVVSVVMLLVGVVMLATLLL